MKIDRTVTTIIDEDKCIGCGACVEVCPQDTISLVNDKAAITGDESLICDHCRAACPSGAITVGGLDDSLSKFTHFEIEKEWLPHGKFNTSSLVNLMQSRRSCRQFDEKPVEKSLLEDLIKIGVTAPSGSNCQLWTFTVLPDRSKVLELGDQIKNFFKKMNNLAEKTWLRKSLKLMGKPELDWYHANYYEQIKEAIALFEGDGKDLLFHGATAAILVGSKTDASCPGEDALLATQNILLGAHSLGLGTCLIGYAVSAMEREKGICRYFDIPDDEKIYAVIAIGYPQDEYQVITGRKPATIRIIDR